MRKTAVMGLVLLCLAGRAAAVCWNWNNEPSVLAFGVGAGRSDPLLVDMDNDGLPDVVTYDVDLTITYSRDYRRTARMDPNRLHTAIAIADFNRDGWQDIVVG